MAITINTQILGQQATTTPTYCYLYEPLRIVLSESDVEAQKFYIDLEIRDLRDNTIVVEDLFRYGDFDINPGKTLSIDLMKIARQHHNAGVYIYSHIDEITESTAGWNSSVSKYIYNFKIYSDINQIPIEIKKIPIIGGRTFQDFRPVVSQSQALTEAQINNVSLDGRWVGYPFLTTILGNPISVDAKPTIVRTTSIKGRVPCGGFLVWKSRFGGWMVWGFEIKTRKKSSSYINSLQSGMFESTAEINGQPYIPVDYTEKTTSYSLTLKTLSLGTAELEAVSGIEDSPAVYYMSGIDGNLELMRLESASVPLSNQANGGDFSVSLSSISTTSQKTR